MKTPISLAMIALSSLMACSQKASAHPTSLTELPPLHEIEVQVLQRPYGCTSSYQKSALFVSSYSERMNAPEVLYNGACGGPSYFDVTLSNDDDSLIADLGPVPLESVTASKAINYQRTVGYDNPFKKSAKPVEGHTYAVLINKPDTRGMLVFQVDSMAKNGPILLRYAVKNYQIQAPRSESNPQAGNIRATLNTPQGHVFSTPYSCRGSYHHSALFLSDYARRRNAPELLYNAACGSEPYFDVSMAGDSTSTIVDLGPIQVDYWVGSSASSIFRSVGGDWLVAKDSVPAKVGHSYAVIINTSDVRGLFVFTVDGIWPNGTMAIRYHVKNYQVLATVKESPGFSWEAGNWPTR